MDDTIVAGPSTTASSTERGTGDPPPGTAVVQVPHDTTELPTRVGEVLEVLTEDLLSGWLWCRADNGRQGWVPVAAVEDLADVT